jgi:hypothetical protein
MYLVETSGLCYCEKPFYTAPLKFGTPAPLLTLTNRPELHPRGTPYTNDTLGRVWLRKLIVHGIEKTAPVTWDIELIVGQPLEFEFTLQRAGCSGLETIVITRQESAEGEILVSIDSKEFPGLYQQYPINTGYEVFFERIKRPAHAESEN